MWKRSIIRAQVWVRAKTSETCYSHPEEKVIYCCQNELCDQALACTECVTTAHQGHVMVSLGDTVGAKAEKIQQVADKAKTSILPNVLSSLTDTEEKIKSNKTAVQNSISEIRRQQEHLRSELDKVTNEMIQKCLELEEENNTFLEECKEKLLKYKTDIEMRIQECNETLSSGTNFQIHDLYMQVRDGCDVSLPNVYIPRNIFYTPYRIKPDSFDGLHGLLNVTDANFEAVDFNTSFSEKGDPIARHSLVSDVAIPLLSEFEKNGLYDVRPTSKTDAWIFKDECNLLLNVSNTGQIRYRIKLDSNINDCCTSPQNQDLWICCDNRSIWKYTSDEKSPPRKNFHTQKKTLCICATETNVIVGYADGLTSYKPDGEIIVESGKNHLGAPTVSQPFFIAICPVTGRIAVTDRDKKGINSESRPHIVILDESLKMQFCYRGYNFPKQLKGRAGISVLSKELDPFAISFDTCGNLLVADCSTDSVIQLDRDGNMVRTICRTSNGFNPYSLHVSQDNILWLVLGKEKNVFVGFKKTLSKIKVFDLSAENFMA